MNFNYSITYNIIIIIIIIIRILSSEIHENI